MTTEQFTTSQISTTDDSERGLLLAMLAMVVLGTLAMLFMS